MGSEPCLGSMSSRVRLFRLHCDSSSVVSSFKRSFSHTFMVYSYLAAVVHYSHYWSTLLLSGYSEMKSNSIRCQ